MPEPLPEYDHPPVAETAMSVQFKPLRRLRSAHLGAFWHSCLRERFPVTEDAPPIVNEPETFGDDGGARSGLPRLIIGPEPTMLRLTDAESKVEMIQLQNGRLVFNWRRMGKVEYPRWEHNLARFQEVLAALKDFVATEGLGDWQEEQWEVNYVNHIMHGDMWQTYEDVPAIVPGLFGAMKTASGLEVDGLRGGIRHEITPQLGRLYVEVDPVSAKTSDGERSVAIRLLLTARGSLPAEGVEDLEAGLQIGRECIVRSFTAVTSEDAHKRWGRTR